MSERSRLGSRPILETTTIPPHKTAAEINELLVRMGARHISLEFAPDRSGRITGMSFSLPPPPGFPKDASPLHYSMPVRTERILQLLKERQRGWADSDRLQEKADRIAWRQLLLWTRAQLAMIETGMAEPAEVLLPYCQGEGGQTLYQFFMVHGPKMLASPKA